MNDDAIYDFPPSVSADERGLVAIGGNLSTGTLLNAYTKGIFPWFNAGEVIQWYSPDPRFVLFPSHLRISHSMRSILKKGLFSFTIDKAFPDVIHGCKTSRRREGNGTWIGDDMEAAYTSLFHEGIAHSAEAWEKNQLAGGLYGVLLGKVFFGESMFSRTSNASKFALIQWVKELQEKGVELIDCQVYTRHLESLGARFISRTEFERMLKRLIA